MASQLTECELCGEMRRCKDGICKQCDKDLDNFISLAYLLLQAQAFLLPWIIGMREVRKYEKD